jgi:hypothetical protein
MAQSSPVLHQLRVSLRIECDSGHPGVNAAAMRLLLGAKNWSQQADLIRRKRSETKSGLIAWRSLILCYDPRRWVLPQHAISGTKHRIRRTAMLVLRRRKGEQIIINEVIRIYVAQASEGSCTLSIEAPDSFVIRRGELPPFESRVPRGISSSIQATK